MAADGGWNEARKSSDSGNGKRLEEAIQKISQHQVSNLIFKLITSIV